MRHCLCGEVPAIANATRVVIVRHHLERHRASNTGRLAHLALANSVLVEHGREEPAALPPLDDACLLFPIGEAAERPATPPRQLVVLDATWSQARRMYRKLPELRGIPVWWLPANARPERLREAPSRDRVSTIEAIAQALRVVEGDEVAAPLDRLFALAVERMWDAGRQRPAIS